jgi:hypothetical protein
VKDKENLGYMLLASNLIDEVQMQVALEEQKRTGRKFGSTLVDLKFIDENVLAAFLSKQIDIPCISLLNIDIPKKIIRRLPAYAAHEFQAIPIRLEGEVLLVAMADPTDEEIVTRLENASGMRVSPLIAPQSSIAAMVRKLYPLPSLSSGDDTGRTIHANRTLDQQVSGASDPMFMDLIAELEDADIEGRLTRLEDRLNEIWILLEKILRTIEGKDALRDRLSNRHLE